MAHANEASPLPPVANRRKTPTSANDEVAGPHTCGPKRGGSSVAVHSATRRGSARAKSQVDWNARSAVVAAAGALALVMLFRR